MAKVTKILTRSVLLTVTSFVVMLVTVPILGQLGNAQVHAQEQQKKSTERKTKKTPTLNLKMYEKLQEAQKQNEAGDTAGALETLDSLRAPKKYSKYNGYDKAMLWNLYAYIYYSMENYSKTIEAYENVLKQPDLPEALNEGALYSLSQIYYVTENYSEAVSTLEKWFKVANNPSASAYLLLGQGYYQLKNSAKAIPAVEKAIEITRARQKPVKENWYLLLRAMYYGKEDYKKTFDILRTLAHEYPKKEYYSQLSAMYGELKEEFNRYSLVAAMDDASMMEKSSEVVTYAQFLLQNERPFKAARILEQGFKDEIVEKNDRNFRLLGNAWTLAKEDKKAIPAYESAAKLADTGEIYASLGQAYLNIEQWDNAISSVKKAFGKKGELKRPDTAYVVLGMAYFNKKNYSESLKAFKKCRNDKRSEKICTQWSRYVKNERDREDSLRKGFS